MAPVLAVSQHRLAFVLGVSVLLLSSASSCFTPPVVLPAHTPGWKLKESDFPPSTALVEVPLESGEVLRGILVPSDLGAPLVVHFAESGSSTTKSFSKPRQYRDLAQIGFASLAVDYRGVGRSDGEPSPEALVEDARAIYAYALELVAGDAQRLVIRGASIGTLAAGAVLRSSPQPALTVLFAPVLGESVARRFGYATRSDILVWLVAPFLEPATDVDLVDVLERHVDGELLVVGSAADELVSADEWERIVRATESAGGSVVESRVSISFGEAPFSEQLRHHIGATWRAYSVREEEKNLLKQAFPDAPDVDARVENLLARVSPDVRQRLTRDAEVQERLRQLFAERVLDSDLLLASLALSVIDTRVAVDLLEMEDQAPVSKRVFATHDPVELAAQLDLDDPSGPLSSAVLIEARQALRYWWKVSPTRLRDDWSVHDVRVLCELLSEALERENEGSTDRIMRSTQWRLGPVVDGVVEIEGWSENGTRRGRVHCGPLLGLLEPERELAEADRRRRLLRLLLKAAGHADLVVRGADGSWRIELLRDGATVSLEDANLER